MKKTVKLNASLKEGYRVDLKAGNHTMIIDQPVSGGGKDEGPSPLAVFLFSLGGCLATIAKIVSKQERIDLRGVDVYVEGDIDTDYLMGKTTEGRAGFTEIRVKFDIDADMTQEEKQAFFERVDARCPISCNMVNDTKIIFDVN